MNVQSEQVLTRRGREVAAAEELQEEFDDAELRLAIQLSLDTSW